ncbi:hypothetical protein QTP88_000174 [Uroleucon formosanum]
MLFSAIRAKGGFNNNPTVSQFEAAYKSIIVHSEIKSSSSANCMALDDTTILRVSSSNIKVKDTQSELLDLLCVAGTDDLENDNSLSVNQHSNFINDVVACRGSFLCKLEEEPAMHNFKAYFVSTYVHRKKLWAACYRRQAMINTNMVLEAFHKTLKHVYLKGKKNQRLDALLWHLLKVVRDKNFERLVKLCNGGKVTHFVNVINSRHRSALQTNYKVIKISDDTWSVASNSLELDYLIKQNEPCSCKVICIVCKCCVHLSSCTCYDYCIKNNMCKHIHVVRMNSMVNNEDVSMNSMDVICNPMANDEVCMKMPAAQQLNVPSTESNANKIQQLYNMFVSQAGTLDEQQLQTINLTVDSSLKVLYQQESKCMNDVEYREPANKNIDKQLRFYSTKKPRTKAPEEQRLKRPTIKVIKQIKSDLKGNEDTPYVNIDPHFEHSYGQFEQKKK